VPETFEEFIVRELDGLYAGALFLTAGHEKPAEELVIRTSRRAFHAFRAEEAQDPPERWLEERLVAEFLDSRIPEERNGRMTGNELHEAMASMSARERCAVWLVVLRRWSYDRAAAAIGIDREGLRRLLRARSYLLEALHGRRTQADAGGAG